MRPPSTPGQRLLVTLVLWACCLAGFLVWFWATPLWSSPDSPAHVMRALGAGEGELVTEPAPATDPGMGYLGYTTVPRGVRDSAASAGCSAFQPAVPADCLAPVGEDPAETKFANPAGQNNPAYYVAVGWPTSFLSPPAAVTAAHVLAAVLASLFLAWGLTAALWSRRPAAATAGVLLTATPTVCYLGATVNPNGLEITAAIAMTACTWAFLQAPAGPIGPMMLRRASLAASAMVLARVMAPLWVAVLAFAVVLVARQDVWSVLRRRASWPWLGLPVLAGLVSLSWTRATGLLDAVRTGYAQNSWWTNVGLARERIEPGAWREQLGTFGWLDTSGSSNLGYTLYAGVVFTVVVLALLVASRRQAAALLLLTSAAYLVPILVQAAQWNNIGPAWQGRYSLPLTVMPVLVAGFILASAERPPRRTPYVLGVAAAVWAGFHIWMMHTLLHRNVSGIEGPSAYDGPWEPAGSAELVMAAYTVLVLAVAAGVLVMLRRERAGLPEPESALA